MFAEWKKKMCGMPGEAFACISLPSHELVVYMKATVDLMPTIEFCAGHLHVPLQLL
jgi:hypothetical protein